MDSNDSRRSAMPAQDSASTHEAIPAASETTDTMFNPPVDVWEETRRAERKRIAKWGLATGGVMAVILALCVLLAYLASSS